jgi:hypothetical protein
MQRISACLLVFAGVFVSYYAWVELQELSSGSSSTVVQWSRDVQSSMQNWVERTGGARLALGALIVLGAAVAITLVLRRPGGAERRDEPAAGAGTTGDGGAVGL